MTGTYSRHFFVELSEQSIRTSLARGVPISMLMIDLDYLKSINDRYGHLAGDKALALVAEVAQNVLDPGDFIGRLGGDEFCAMLPGRDHDCAMKIAERLVAAMQRSRYDFAPDISPGMSIGVATAHTGLIEDYDSLWLRADSALYVAKGQGRCQVASDMDA
jgi:diguanylate cyclase (GGDEF)-like protein